MTADYGSWRRYLQNVLERGIISLYMVYVITVGTHKKEIAVTCK